MRPVRNLVLSLLALLSFGGGGRSCGRRGPAGRAVQLRWGVRGNGPCGGLPLQHLRRLTRLIATMFAWGIRCRHKPISPNRRAMTGSRCRFIHTYTRSTSRRTFRCLRIASWKLRYGIATDARTTSGLFQTLPTAKRLPATGTSLSGRPTTGRSTRFNSQRPQTRTTPLSPIQRTPNRSRVQTCNEQLRRLRQDVVNFYYPKAVRRGLRSPNSTFRRRSMLPRPSCNTRKSIPSCT